MVQNIVRPEGKELASRYKIYEIKAKTDAWKELERININYFETLTRSVQDLCLFPADLAVCRGVDMKRIRSTLIRAARWLPIVGQETKI